MDEQERIEMLKNEPVVPGIQWVIGLVILLGIQILIWSPSNLILILQISLFVVSVLLIYNVWLLLKCDANKKNLHSDYKRLYISYEESQKTLKSQIALNKKQDDELATVNATKSEEVSALILQYISSQAAATISLNQQRKDD